LGKWVYRSSKLDLERKCANDSAMEYKVLNQSG
jgi:hypothetical protein